MLPELVQGGTMLLLLQDKELDHGLTTANYDGFN